MTMNATEQQPRVADPQSVERTPVGVCSVCGAVVEVQPHHYGLSVFYDVELHYIPRDSRIPCLGSGLAPLTTYNAPR